MGMIGKLLGKSATGGVDASVVGDLFTLLPELKAELEKSA